MKVSIYRYNPETDREPSMKEYEVDTQGKDLMVLDILALVKEQDESMSYRRSCREGVCGSDGMNMNGKNGLACITPLSQVAPGVLEGKKPLILRPLPGLPVNGASWLAMKDDVLLARTAWSGARPSISPNTFCFSGRSSKTASMTTSQSPKPR